MVIRVPAELTDHDPVALASAVGLAHITDDEPGLQRVATDDGFAYQDRSGSGVDDAAIARIEALAIPPAWRDVWISPLADGYLQATGRDDAGRKQHRYHATFREFAEQRKFDRLRYFARALVQPGADRARPDGSTAPGAR